MVHNEQIRIEAEKNLQDFKELQRGLKELAESYGKTYEEVMKDLGPIPISELTPEKMREIFEK